METRITARLRDQLGTAKNANEMFRIFSRFNALFVRPHIRGAIREYQTQLIQRVKDDIESLHDKFKVRQIFIIYIVPIFFPGKSLLKEALDKYNTYPFISNSIEGFKLNQHRNFQLIMSMHFHFMRYLVNSIIFRVSHTLLYCVFIEVDFEK